MKMIKQKRTTDGTVAMDCAVCAIAMLTDLPYVKVLADMPNYKATSDFQWMQYLNLLGFEATQVDEISPPLGHRLYCGIDANIDEKKIAHAIAVDEEGSIFNPSNTAPATGTHTLADCLAQGTFRKGNGRLHITSTRFDEPQCLKLVGASTRAIAIHGCRCRESVVCLGGLDSAALKKLRVALEERGFVAKIFCRHLEGREKKNIVNQTKRGMGVQLELSSGLRRSFFKPRSTKGRRQKTRRFRDFVAAVRESICA